MVKSKNKYNALEDAYFKKLETTQDTAIVALYKQREKTKIQALEAKKQQWDSELQKMNMEDTTRAKILQEKIIEANAQIREYKERVDDPGFEERSLSCKRFLQDYKTLKNEQSELEVELEALENEPAEAKKQEIERIKRKAQLAKKQSTSDLTDYIRSQVRPELLACLRGLSCLSATAHLVHVRCDALRVCTMAFVREYMRMPSCAIASNLVSGDMCRTRLSPFWTPMSSRTVMSLPATSSCSS
jgi:hypothetical protein